MKEVPPLNKMKNLMMQPLQTGNAGLFHHTTQKSNIKQEEI